MNCKQGDLAIVIRSVAGNEGKIVRCLQFLGSVPGFGRNDYWLIDREMPTKLGASAPIASDGWIRPINNPGDDAVDETLLRLPSPRQEVTA